MNAGRLFFGLLVLVVLGSAIALVYSRYLSRTLFVELRALEQARDEMSIEWGQLQLEQSTWATHGRIEKMARTRLHMTIPRPEDVVIVRP
jgi:cell division protein FtsL